MVRSIGLRPVAAALILICLLPSLAAPPQVAALPWIGRTAFASPNFANQWARTDSEQVRTGRTLYWGPGPWFDYYEFYRDAPNGLRLVQYFDKARMEVNRPADGLATNGLLVVEMVSGQEKLGDSPYDNVPLGAATIPVAGDPFLVNPDAPTYASFAGTATLNDPKAHRDPERFAQSINAFLDRSGAKSQRDDLARAYADQTRVVQYIPATGHNIPAIFWTFLNQRGAIEIQGEVKDDQIVDWLGAMGYPITDPYWVTTRVGGVEQTVLTQLFERRVLTYTPSNPAGYQVEMGNVGQHYFGWRYASLGQPWAVEPTPDLPIFFASRRASTHWEVYRMLASGINPSQFVVGSSTETVPYSLRRAYAPNDALSLFIDSRRGDGIHRQLYAVRYGNGQELQRLTNNGANDYNPAISPDGAKIAFVSDRYGATRLFIMAYRPGQSDTGNQNVIDLGGVPVGSNCVHQAPSWSPDGRRLIWMSDCSNGHFEIYRGDLNYYNDSADAISVSLTNIIKLTDNDRDDTMPRYSPTGAIAFQSNREGSFAIYVMDGNGDGQKRLTRGAGNESAPTWSADGTQVAYSAQRASGVWGIERINADGSGQTRLSTGTADDNWPVWAA